jgi:hypothetical protein
MIYLAIYITMAFIVGVIKFFTDKTSKKTFGELCYTCFCMIILLPLVIFILIERGYETIVNFKVKK